MSTDDLAAEVLAKWRESMSAHEIAELLESIDTLIEIGE